MLPNNERLETFVELQHETRLSVDSNQDATPATSGARQSLVLHVSMNMGGGLQEAICDYVESAPEYRHGLLFDAEASFATGALSESQFESVIPLPSNPLRAIKTIRKQLRELRPDIIHAHSSFAGAYVRLAAPRRYWQRIVYTPHCYAFHRLDIGRPKRLAYWAIEALLTLACPRIAACSPLEAQSASRFPGALVTYVPNRIPRQVLLDNNVRHEAPSDEEVLKVVAVGRLCSQKAPQHFAMAAEAASSAGRRMQWIWVGGGDDELQSQLERAGVKVTGWIQRREAIGILATSDVYVHTASWEGAPLSILEAASLNIPILARRTPSMTSLGIEPLWENADQLVSMLIAQPAIMASTQETTRLLRERHSPQRQREALLSVYSSALMGAPSKVRKS